MPLEDFADGVLPDVPPINLNAVIDIGSNSVRLVIFDRLSRFSTPVFNEKVLVGLGADMKAGKMHAERMRNASNTIARFARITAAMGVSDVETVATAAVRDAVNGPDFVQSVEQRTGLTVRVLSGQEEAHYSGLGVLSAFPDADGVMGDIGGGSLELVSLNQGALGEGVTMPVGLLRLQDRADGDLRKAKDIVDQELAAVPWLPDLEGRNLYIVGGSWRAIAKLYMERLDYPLEVIQDFVMPTAVALKLCDEIAGMSIDEVGHYQAVPRRRVDTLPFAAVTLQRLLKAAKPKQLCFSAYGVREGLQFEKLSEEARAQDPLFASCKQIAQRAERFGRPQPSLWRWMKPLIKQRFPHLNERLLRAACIIRDVAWRTHPDYRGEHAAEKVFHAPFVAISHPGRAYLALSVYSVHEKSFKSEVVEKAMELLDEKTILSAQATGFAIRLGVALSGGSDALLERTRIFQEGENLVLEVAPDCHDILGEPVDRRMQLLSRALGLDPLVRVAEM